MRTTPQLVADLYSYHRPATSPEVNLRERVLNDMKEERGATIQNCDINKGFRLIDDTLQYSAAAESLAHQMQLTGINIPQLLKQHDLLNTGLESKLIYPRGKRTRLSASIEIITAVVTLSCYIIAVALIAIVGKIFFFMNKYMAKTFARAVAFGLKMRKNKSMAKSEAQHTTSTEIVTIKDVENWSHAAKVPKLLSGKTGEVKLEAKVLAKALLSEWVLPTMKPYASTYLNDPSVFSALLKGCDNAASNLDRTVEELEELASSLAKSATGKDVNTNARVGIMTEVVKRTAATRSNIELFAGIEEKHTPAKIPKNLDAISGQIVSYNYEPPTQLLKAVKAGTKLESRIKIIEKTLKENKAGISKESNAEITQGLNTIKKSLKDIHQQNLHINKIFQHNTDFAATYMSYLGVMNSVL